MSDQPVIVSAMLTFKETIPQEVRDFLPELVARTRAEDGCVTYAPHLPLEGENKLYFHEIWRDKPSLEKHGASAHLAKFRELTGPHLVGGKSDVTLWRPMD